MNELELHELANEHVSDLMEYGEAEYGDTMNTLTLDFVINEVTENIDDSVFKSWVETACEYKVMILSIKIRKEVRQKVYEIIHENLSALNVDREE